MSNGFFGRMSKGRVGAALIATLSLGLGGCNNKEKEQIKTLSADNEDLKARNASLEQGLATRTTRSPRCSRRPTRSRLRRRRLSRRSRTTPTSKTN